MKFSVAMCTYNGARYLPEQLGSLAGQTRPPDELVVCDDRSSDETVRLVEEYAARAPFPVRLTVNETNLGSTKNFERAISLCRGDIIALCDQDDVWLPEKLARMEAVFQRSPRVGLVFTDAAVVDERLRPLGRTMWQGVRFTPAEQDAVEAGRALQIFLEGEVVTGATAAFRTELRRLVLPIPTDVPLIHDGWLALVAASVAGVALCREPLIEYRQHAAQQVGAPVSEPSEETTATLRSKWEAVHEAAERSNPYDEQLTLTRALFERLRERDGAGERRGAVAMLEARHAHLEARSGLPRRRLMRAPRVMRELLARRYHRFSNGFRSAAKDLLLKGA